MSSAATHLADRAVPRARAVSRAAGVLVVLGVLLAVAGGAVAVAVLASGSGGGDGSGDGGAATVTGAVAPVVGRSLLADRPEVRAARLLDDWGERRAAAWAAADPAALDALYVPGSPAARAERRLLARWSARGLRVEQLHDQLLAVEVLDHAPGRWHLEVVDRVQHARVVAADGTTGPLPRDGPRTTRVVLVDRPGRGWVVAEVSAVRS